MKILNMMLLSLMVALMFLSGSSARRFKKCELATLLEGRYGMSRNEIKDWVCIAEFESSFNTESMNKNNVDGSWDYGLFQINNRYWCEDGRGGSNGCGIQCTALLTDDITAAVNCARLIKNQQGLTAWEAYKNTCRGMDLNAYMAECWRDL